MDPKNTDALVAKGWTLDLAGFSVKDVVSFFDKALEIDPQCTPALLNKGLVYDRTGLFAKAVKCFEQILSYDPDNVRALYSKAVSLFSLKKHGGGHVLVPTRHPA